MLRPNYRYVALVEIDSKTMYLRQESLVGGKDYYFLLEAWNPNSHVASYRYEFLVNKPPFGGECGIEPNEGMHKYLSIVFKMDTYSL